jgi:hypothetical protein
MLLRSIHRLSIILFPGILLLSALAVNVGAKDKHPKPTPPARDEILVVAHIPTTGDAVTGFLTTQHYKRNYLYAEHASGKTVTLIDVTNVSSPALLAEMSDPAGISDALVAVTGNAALVATANQQASAPPGAQNFRILSFADPLHPTIQQEFKGITATARDDKRGLIFLANADGIWILQQQYAIDPAQAKLQKEIERSIYETP